MPDALCRRGVLRRATIVLALLAAVAALGFAPRLAHAAGRAGPTPPSLYAPGWQAGAPAIAGRAAWRGGVAAWRAGADLAAEAARYLGSGKFTSLPGPWCADAVSFWLKATGRPPLASRMAASGFAYGRALAAPEAGALVVTSHHVGVVARVYADGSFDMISGNWGHRVAAAHMRVAPGMAFRRP